MGQQVGGAGPTKPRVAPISNKGAAEDASAVLKGALTASEKLVATAAADDFDAYETLVFSHVYLGGLFEQLDDPDTAVGHYHVARTINHQFLVREGNYQVRNMQIDTLVISRLGVFLQPLRDRTDLNGLVLTRWQRLALQDSFAIIDLLNQTQARQNNPPVWLEWLERLRPWVAEPQAT
jgi:hypothetical protein